MNILIVGDVHGCFHTFQELLDKYWKDGDILIQLGDLIDRGNFSAETVQFVQSLQASYKDRTIFLKGNHELELIDYEESGTNKNWLQQRGAETLSNFLSIGLSLSETAQWMRDLPLVWENDYLCVTHTRVSQTCQNPFNPYDRDGVLWTRQSLKNIGKVQIFGHTPTSSGAPEYDAVSNSWNIDTGACFSGKLSAIKFASGGEFIDTYSVKAISKDVS